MKLLIVREPSKIDLTHGSLFLKQGSQANSFCCYTLEDEKREVKVKGETRIPAGTYEIKLRIEGGLTKKYEKRYGDMHKGMLHLQDVPEFKYIYIHTGNTDDHTDGCILVGRDRNEETIGRSRDAYKRLYPVVAKAILSGEEVMIEIRDAE